MSARFAAGIAGAVALATACLLTAAWALSSSLLEIQPLPPVLGQDLEIQAEAVATLEGVVRYRRNGRVLKFLRKPGDKVAAGDPIVQFEDLGLQASKSDLDEEIARLREQAAEAEAARQETASELPRQLRLAALQQLEESYEVALKEFERWKALHAEGLVARLDFERKEREFAALGVQLREARATAASADAAGAGPAEDPSPPGLRRAERLRQRLDRLSDTFDVRSPWDGSVREFHVQQGELPEMGSPLATIDRAARPLLVAEVKAAGRIVAVRSACEVPGPIPFTIEKGRLSMSVPAAGTRPGDRCRVVLLARK